MNFRKLQLEPLEARQMMAVWSPGIRISDATVDEGGMATLTVSRDDTSYLTGSVKWATASGTAGTADYTAASGTLKFGSRELSKTIQIQTKQDTLVEGLESFAVNLTSAKYGKILDGEGIVTIRDNDVAEPPTDPPTDPPPVPTGDYGPRVVSQPAGSRAITSISSLPSDSVLYLRAGTYSGTLTLRTGQRLVAESGAILNLSGTLNIPSGASVENLDIRGGRPSSEWGASVTLGTGAKLINCEVSGGRYAGVAVGANAILEGCDIHDNARTGIIANDVSGGIVRGNDVHRNNPDKAWDIYDEAGGSKFWNTKNFLLENNRFRDNQGNGIWFDYNNADAIVRGNQTSGNTLAGIFWEISFGAIIENNTSVGDGKGYSLSGWLNGAAIVVENSYGTASKPIIVRNNTSTDSTNGIGIINEANRSEETHGGDYPTAWVQVIGNTLNNSGKSGYVGSGGKPSNLTWSGNILTGNSRLVGNL